MTVITAGYGDYNDIYAVLSDDDIMRRTAGDATLSQLSDALRISLSRQKYVCGYIGGKPVSAYFITPSGYMHFAVLPQYRRYASRLLKASRAVMPQRVTCRVPKKFNEVIRFARHNGFVRSGESGENIILRSEAV